METPPGVAPEEIAPRTGLRIWLPAHLRDPLYRTGYLLIVGAGTGSLLGFLFWALAARSYPAHVVGLSSALISAMMLVSAVCQLGLNAVLVRYVPAAGSKTRALVVRSYALTIGLSLVCGLAAARASGLWSSNLQFLAYDPAWMLGFTVATTVWTVFALQDSVMTGLQAAHWVPIENSLFSAAKLILLVGVTGLAPVAGPFIAWNAPVGLAVILITVLIFRRLIPRQRRRAVGEAINRRRLIRVAAGNYIASLLSLPVTYLMPVLVANETNLTTTAYFYGPWMIASAMLLVANNTAISLTVEAALDETQLRVLLRRSFAHTMRLVVPMTGVVVLVAPLILRAFGEPYVHAGTPLLRLLALGAVPNVVAALGLAVARIQHRGSALIAIQAAQSVPLLITSVLLLSHSGIAGVGVAFLVSQSLVAVGLLATLLRPLLRITKPAG